MPFAADAALIVVDVQQGFDDPSWGRRDNPFAEANIAALATHWENTGRPIIVVRHDSRSADSPLAPGTPGNALQPRVAAITCSLFVVKHVNSAFYGDPDLHGWLTERGISQLVICGIQTNHCVETTARMAGNLGYDTTVALDATYTFDLAGDGVTLSAEHLARATAVNLDGGGFARIRRTHEIIDA